MRSASHRTDTIYRSPPPEGSPAEGPRSLRGDRVLLLVIAATGLIPLSGAWLRQDVPDWQLGFGTLLVLAPLVELARDLLAGVTRPA